jgi:3-oxoacyl-[acyl-carrier protein] reductase
LSPGSTILITGSRQGLGRALAEHYLRNGQRVFGLSRSDTDLKHPGYQHFCADVADEKMMQQVFSQIGASGAGLQVLLCAAGVKTGGYALLTPAKQADEMLRTNLLGAFLVTRHALNLMKRGRFGRVIYFSSIAVPLGSAGTAVYGASKAGLEQLSYALSREFARENITFNALGISIYASAMVEALGEKALQETREALIKPDNLKVEEVAGAIDFFASDAARQITGQTLYFGGVR